MSDSEVRSDDLPPSDPQQDDLATSDPPTEDETVRMTPLLWALGIGATLLGVVLGLVLSAVSFRP